ncbi:protein PIN-LIKES 3-like [Coffea arabica]|uniref:Protein PIN-LIKES 3-like n=1 Tax=Coffea arabica TaxID=13443 RepID=A0A6P6TIX3_COFAR|nr:protein PIN-LIKES 3-like [Coffea arabica]XP_027078463.1 protein PIN-LIKES 3-like [Coffea arabica]XP_027078464.1 protein PIN-LIKES 3-like [Coffea arabica]XP_027078465.1 protein PIN-LIKES 3-like [Coffea arabica]XP_027078466.1 protein PIN-LIKES 3-like [Coffea arabica]XP_027078467.1 protein PIN-LIKES 3-like [Coffea arabica]XP_027078468.1 protein PIN-LIKES 3-like [Coffea arabica]
MGFLALFIVALIPVLKTLIVTAVGLFLALEKVDILGDTARHHLNNLVFFVFTPALVSSSLAETITMSSLIKLWFMPVNILLTFIIGSALGWVLVKVLRTPQHLHGLVIGCCAAGNLGNLLLIIIPAVCEESNSPFGDSSTCSTNGEAYASLSMAIGAVFIWTYVYNIVRAYGIRSTGSTINRTNSANGGEIVTESSLEESLLSKDIETDHSHDTPQPIESIENYEKVPMRKKIKQQLKILAERMNLKMMFAPSTIATIVGLAIGATSPLRKLLIGDSAPLRVIDTSTSMLGDASIPAMTLIVGANLLKGLQRSEVGLGIIIGVQVVRYIAMPLLGILVVKAAVHFGLVGSDSLYQFVLLLQYALPTAMSMGTITQLFEVGERDCSVIMLWNYAVAALALTLWSTYYLWFVS